MKSHCKLHSLFFVRLSIHPPAPRWLNSLIVVDACRTSYVYDCISARGFVKSAFCVIELMQLLSQAMWVHDSPLRQLPHLTDKEIRFAGKKGFNDLQRFKNGSVCVSAAAVDEPQRPAITLCACFTDVRVVCTCSGVLFHSIR
jgi:hypothetical protein